jgi:hypothetical protein
MISANDDNKKALPRLIESRVWNFICSTQSKIATENGVVKETFIWVANWPGLINRHEVHKAQKTWRWIAEIEISLKQFFWSGQKGGKGSLMGFKLSDCQTCKHTCVCFLTFASAFPFQNISQKKFRENRFSFHPICLVVTLSAIFSSSARVSLIHLLTTTVHETV